MSREPRRRGESGIYHIYTRGVNGRVIFADDADRRKICYIVGDALDEHGGELYAWCLMDNHMHFVLKNDLPLVSKQLSSIKGRYAQYFNRRHDRYGHLFQGRFGSKPIDTERYLLTAVRYVHLNPVAAGLCRTCAYAWSSYRDYVSPGDCPQATHRHRPRVEVDSILEAFGGRGRFVAAHVPPASEACQSLAQLERELADAETIDALERGLGSDVLARLGNAAAPERDRLLREAKALGLPIARLARVTGIGRSIVQRA